MRSRQIDTILGKFNMFSADNFFLRLKGLLYTKSLPKSECLLITPCTSVHTIGMRYSINVVFLDKSNVILSVKNQLAPNRICLAPSKTVKVVEFSSDMGCILSNVIGLKFMEGNL